MAIKKIFLVVEPNHRHAYWFKSVIQAIKDTAYKYQLRTETLELGTGKIADIDGKYIMIVARTTDFVAQQSLRILNSGGFPLVVNDKCDLQQHFPHSSVYIDIDELMRISMEYLVSSGRKKIALIGSHMHEYPNKRKVSVFNRYSEYMNLSGYEMFLSPSGEDDLGGARRFLEGDTYKNFDAVIALNNTAGIYCAKKLKQKGAAVPEDVYIIGHGNSYVSKFMSPSLTVVNYDFVDFGKMAVKLWRFLEECHPDSTVNVRIPYEIIPRETTKGRAHKTDYSKLGSMIFEDADEGIPVWSKDTNAIIQVEDILQHCDDIDKQIVMKGVLNLTYEQIGEKNNLSARAIRYRASKIISDSGFENAKDFYSLVRDAFN